MIVWLIATASATPVADDMVKVESCRAAVHGQLETAAITCEPSKATINLLEPESLPAACRVALERGMHAGMIGPKVTAPIRSGLIRNFDQAHAQCVNPPAETEVPMREVPQLWNTQ